MRVVHLPAARPATQDLCGIFSRRQGIPPNRRVPFRVVARFQLPNTHGGRLPEHGCGTVSPRSETYLQ